MENGKNHLPSNFSLYTVLHQVNCTLYSLYNSMYSESYIWAKKPISMVTTNVKKFLKIEKIYFYTFWCTLVGTRSKTSLKTKFLKQLTLYAWYCIIHPKSRQHLWTGGKIWKIRMNYRTLISDLKFEFQKLN